MDSPFFKIGWFFLKVDDNVGLTYLDEPAINQSDKAIVDMQLRNATKEVWDISLLYYYFNLANDRRKRSSQKIIKSWQERRRNRKLGCEHQGQELIKQILQLFSK